MLDIPSASFNGLTERFEKAKTRLDAVTDEIHQMQTQRASIEDFLKAFAAMSDELTEFTLESWRGWWTMVPSTPPTTSASPSKTGRKLKPDPRNENGSLPLEVFSGSRELYIIQHQYGHCEEKVCQLGGLAHP